MLLVSLPFASYVVSLFLCLFVSHPKKLWASRGVSVRATSVKLLLVSLPFASYIVEGIPNPKHIRPRSLAQGVRSTSPPLSVAPRMVLVTPFPCLALPCQRQHQGTRITSGTVRAARVKLLLVSLPFASYVASLFLCLFAGLLVSWLLVLLVAGSLGRPR